jgi:hypothetical protein
VSDRVTSTISTSPSSPAPAGPTSGRFMIVGQTSEGSGTTPAIVKSISEYTSLFGSRTGGAAMYDAAQLALRCGASEVVVARATGPNPVKATASLDTGKIVVTAKNPGAFANTWTAAWTSASSELTVVCGSATEVYSGATSAALILNAASSNRITVTSSGTLPSGNISAVTLGTGTDDFASVVWATQLAKLSPDLGSGSVAIPGLAFGTVGQAIATHCVTNKRHGIVTAASGATVATLIAAATTIKGYNDAEYLDLVGPWVTVPDGAGSTKTVDPAAFLGALRANAHRVSPGASAAAEVYARAVVDVTPEYQVSSTDWATLNSARVSTIRTVGAYTRLYTYTMVKAPGGNNNLIGGQYRDLINAVVVGAETILESYTNAMASPARLAQAAGEITAILQPYSDSGYLRSRRSADGKLVIDPGYRVEVSTGAAPADNRITALVSLRMEESVDFVDLIVAVGDATVTL